jgi:sortase (surface protein transpeptidase)
MYRFIFVFKTVNASTHNYNKNNHHNNHNNHNNNNNSKSEKKLEINKQSKMRNRESQKESYENDAKLNLFPKIRIFSFLFLGKLRLKLYFNHLYNILLQEANSCSVLFLCL